MPLITRASFVLALLGAFAGVAVLVFAPQLAGVLSFLFCILWVLWIICIFVTPPAKAMHLVGLWVLIDLGLLTTLLALAPGLALWRIHSGTGGHDLVAFVAYLPVVMPLVLALPSADTFDVVAPLQRILGRDYGELTATWFIMSGVALLQCLLVVAVVWSAQSMLRRKSENSV